MIAVRNPWLLAGGAMSLAAAAVHLGAIAGGAPWYRALGAGERMARLAEAGRVTPHLATLGIAAVLAGFGAWALSGAGVLPRLPLLRPALVAITLVYLARGLVLFWPAALQRPDLSRAFLLWSSAIVLVIGLVHAIGVWRGWTSLNGVS